MRPEVGDLIEDERGRAIIVAHELVTSTYIPRSLTRTYKAYFWRAVDVWVDKWKASFTEQLSPSMRLGVSDPYRSAFVAVRVADQHLSALWDEIGLLRNDYRRIFERRSVNWPRLVFCNLDSDPDNRAATVRFFPFGAVLRDPSAGRETLCEALEQFGDPVCIMRNPVDGTTLHMARFRSMNDLVMARLLGVF